MMKNDVIGVLFSNAGDRQLRDLTEHRCMGSVPFGGRFRMIDFPLSAMVGAGISKIGVTARNNYRSLMDHLGSGKAWDLSRRNGGLQLFPPYSNTQNSNNATRLHELAALMPFLESSKEEYVICSDCDLVFNPDFSAMLEEHIRSGADVTIGYARGKLPRSAGGRMTFTMDEDHRVTEILIDPEGEEDVNYCINVSIHNRAALIRMVRDAVSRNYANMSRDVFQRQLDRIDIRGYEFTGYLRVIDSLSAYLSANTELLDGGVRRELFRSDRPILTKIWDDAPARYTIDGSASDCLVADGCVIDGTVEHCVLFRGAKIGKGAHLSHCVIMENTVVGEKADLSWVITDKNTEIMPGRALMGFDSYPAYIAKNSLV